MSNNEEVSRPRAVVVVLGDIGRSPRMCYHSYSLATKLGYDVTIVGYLDTLPHPIIHSNPNITYAPLRPPPDRLSSIPEGLQLPIKFIWTFLMLLWTLLFRVPFSLHLILMQNPPALPTSVVCWMVARFKRAKFVIDWHNYMYSVLKDKYGIENLNFVVSEKTDGSEGKSSCANESSIPRKKPIREDRPVVGPTRKRKVSSGSKKEQRGMKHRYIEFVYKFEGMFGRRADANLCVTRAMRDDLARCWGVPAAVFYDRPPSWTFGHVTAGEKHDLFMRLGTTSGGSVFGADAEADACRLTYRSDTGEIIWKNNRPLLVISSTSWTVDEDFSILLDAVVKYNANSIQCVSNEAKHRRPPILLIITGRGPMKDYYLEKIAKLKLQNIDILTPWLEPEDYPRLLAAADIGVSLHTSTSGKDLPMKVVDMFGSGLPVLAKRFACIDELVVDGQNGRLFDSSQELFNLLISLATGFPAHCEELINLARNIREDGFTSWEDNWDTNASSILAPENNENFERMMATELLPEERGDYL